MTSISEDIKIFKKYLINNKLFVIWIVLYFVFFWSLYYFDLTWFFILLFLYYVSIKLALSDAGESLLRALYDCRELAMSREKELLLPLFQEVYNKAYEKSSYIAPDIKLYIVDTLEPNAFAIGRKSIVLTVGMINAFDKEELKAFLAHEFAHIANGDTIINIIFKIGNTVFVALFTLLRLIIKRVDDADSNFLISLLRFVSETLIAVFTIVGTALLMINSRQMEFDADMYAFELGYQDSLISALYKTYDYTLGKPKKLLERLQHSHPRIPQRIGAIENFKERGY